MGAPFAGALRPARARGVREVIRAAAFVAALAFCTAASAADPVAFVADLKGNATIEGDGKVSFLGELATGTRLLLGTGAQVAVTYAATGSEFTLTGPGEFVVLAAEVRAEKGAAPKRRAVTSLADPSIVARVSGTATASLRMRGLPPVVPARSALEFPVETRVTSLQPVLRWHAPGASAQATVVRVFDANGTEVWKGWATAPGSARTGVKLSAETRYKWTVMTPSGVLGEGRFETLSAQAAARAEKSRGAAHTFSGRVMHAFLLQDLGATQEAREAWALLARERPDLPELAALAR
jgi:hypothetical protein